MMTEDHQCLEFRTVVRSIPEQPVQEVIRMKELKKGDIFQLFEHEKSIGKFWRATSDAYVREIELPIIWGVDAEPYDA